MKSTKNFIHDSVFYEMLIKLMKFVIFSQVFHLTNKIGKFFFREIQPDQEFCPTLATDDMCGCYVGT